MLCPLRRASEAAHALPPQAVLQLLSHLHLLTDYLSESIPELTTFCLAFQWVLRVVGQSLVLSNPSGFSQPPPLSHPPPPATLSSCSTPELHQSPTFQSAHSSHLLSWQAPWPCTLISSVLAAPRTHLPSSLSCSLLLDSGPDPFPLGSHLVQKPLLTSPAN
jgi:hypothetical protein